MRRDDAIVYLDNLIKDDPDLTKDQKLNAGVFSHAAIYTGALSYRTESSLEKYFVFIKGRLLEGD